MSRVNRRTFLPFSPPSIGEEEIGEVVDTLKSGWISTGPKARRFEEDFAKFLGVDAALAVSSGTDAMLVGLAALGIGQGDAIITTPMTFCSTVHVVEHLGARPILVDVEPDTLNINPALVERVVRQWSDGAGGQGRLRALLPVHLYGHPCEMDTLLDIGSRYGLCVVEDAAHALPAQYKTRMIGTLGTLTAFSFYATKNLTTAEGGMLTGESELIEKARIWSLHGMSRDAYKRYEAGGSWFYEVVVPGYKCNMTDLQAALGLQQLKKLPRFQERRWEIVEKYNHGLADCEELEIQVERPEVASAHHLYVVRLNLECLRIDRARFIENLTALNIGASVHFIPIPMHAYYRHKYGFKPEDFPVAFREYQRIISLPLYPGMTDEDVQDVIDAVRETASRYRR